MWANLQQIADLVTFFEEVLYGCLVFYGYTNNYFQGTLICCLFHLVHLKDLRGNSRHTLAQARALAFSILKRLHRKLDWLFATY